MEQYQVYKTYIPSHVSMFMYTDTNWIHHCHKEMQVFSFTGRTTQLWKGKMALLILTYSCCCWNNRSCFKTKSEPHCNQSQPFERKNWAVYKRSKGKKIPSQKAVWGCSFSNLPAAAEWACPTLLLWAGSSLCWKNTDLGPEPQKSCTNSAVRLQLVDNA